MWREWDDGAPASAPVRLRLLKRVDSTARSAKYSTDVHARQLCGPAQASRRWNAPVPRWTSRLRAEGLTHHIKTDGTELGHTAADPVIVSRGPGCRYIRFSPPPHLP